MLFLCKLVEQAMYWNNTASGQCVYLFVYKEEEFISTKVRSLMQQKDYGISIRTAHNILTAPWFEATVACSIIRISLLLALMKKTDTPMCHLL